MEKDKFIRLLSKKLSNEISENEQELLSHALQNKVYQALATQIERYFNEKRQSGDYSAQLDQTWQKIEGTEKIAITEKFDFTTPKQNPFFSTFLKVAAILILIFSIGLTSYYLTNQNNAASQTLTTSNQKVFKVLDDGTGIWLNKQSTITYNRNFGKHQREITLKGEAYFDVVKNTTVPLIIHVGGIDIEVKGTVFNVNAYKVNEGIEVALVRGIIAVTDRQNTKNSVLLKPNEKLVFSNKKTLQNHKNFQVIALNAQMLQKETSWTADTLIFNKEKLVDLALRLEKKYDLKIEIRSEKLKEKRFSGTFTNETIDQALAALKLSYPLTYTIDKQVVIIKD